MFDTVESIIIVYAGKVPPFVPIAHQALLADISARSSELDFVLLFWQQLCLECTQARSNEADIGGGDQSGPRILRARASTHMTPDHALRQVITLTYDQSATTVQLNIVPNTLNAMESSSLPN